jgi:hypothetical protein
MKDTIHKVLAVIAKPIFLVSILLWSSFTIHFGYLLATGKQIGESTTNEVERNGVEMVVTALFIIVSIAFIRMSWQGLRYWPKRYPKLRFESKATDPVDGDQ